MSGKTSRTASRRPRRRLNWSQVIFMAIGLLVVVAFILSMVTYG
jgi:predicted nucleic acid-binding Zn ribbon protein